jgi:alkylhydroperoxidase family enzyme
MARVPYVSPSDLAEVDRPLLAEPFNIYRALANSPDALRHFAVLGKWIRRSSQVDPRLRELAILQVGYLTRAPYQWAHHVKVGRDSGVTDQDITDVIAATGGSEHQLGEVEALVLRAAREVTAEGRMSEETWLALLGHLGDARLVELTIIISHVNAVSRILNTLEIDVEPEFQRYLDEFPLPDPIQKGDADRGRSGQPTEEAPTIA